MIGRVWVSRGGRGKVSEMEEAGAFMGKKEAGGRCPGAEGQRHTFQESRAREGDRARKEGAGWGWGRAWAHQRDA